MPTIIDRYQELPNLEKTILQLLATSIEPLSKKFLIEMISQRGPNVPKERLLMQKSVSDAIKSLTARKGLTASIDQGKIDTISINPGLLVCCSKEAIKTGTFAAISQQLLVRYPVKDTWGNRYNFRNNYQRFLRHLRFRLFMNDEGDEINTIYIQGYRDFSYHINFEDPIFTLFGTPFDGDYVKLFPARYYALILDKTLDIAEQKLSPLQPLLDFLTEVTDQIPSEDTTRIKDIQSRYCAYMSQWSEVQRHLEAIPEYQESFRLSMEGWQQTMSGHDREAIDLYLKGHALIVKQERTKKTFFNDLPGLFFLISLLRVNTPTELLIAEKYLDLIDSLTIHNLRGFTPFLRRAISLLKGLPLDQQAKKPSLPLPKTSYEKQILSHNIPPVHAFLLILADYWEDKNACLKDWKSCIATLRDQSKIANLAWLTMECSELLARLGVDEKNNRTAAAAIRKEYDLISIIDTVPDIAPWERSLTALIHLGATPLSSQGLSAKPDSEKSQRLIWLLDYSPDVSQCSLLPRLQVVNKSGKWSAGRSVALKTLRQETPSMPGLTPQDQAICSAIKVRYESSGYYGYQRREVLHFDNDEALNKLIGHPLIFLEDSPSTRIDIVAGEPELVVTRDGKGSIEVKMSPEYLEGTQACLVKETPTRFKLVRFTIRHQSIAAVLKSGLQAPGQAEQLTTKAIAALSSVITIHSDLEGGSSSSREVESDPIPHLHLLPYQEGLKAEILVQPLPGAESWYRPGIGGHKVFAEVAGEKLHTARDLAKEQSLTAELIKACPTLSQQEENEGEYLIPTPEDSLELLLELQDVGERAIVEWPQGQTMRLRGRAKASALSIQVKQERDWFKASGTLTIDETNVIALQKLLGLLSQAKGRFVRLDDGSFLALSREFRNRLEELRDYGQAHGDGVRFSPLAAFGLEDLSQEAGEFKGDRHWKKHLARMQEVIDPEVPTTLQAELRDYQVVGFKWLSQLAHWGVGACLADDMGLGKTIQTLTALLRLAPNGPSLVVAPLSVMMNWQDEAERFAPTINIIVFGPGDRQQVLSNLQPFDLVICSYGLLQIEAEKLAEVAWQTIVLDEAQAIKNMNTKRAKAAMNLSGQFKMITTGTPVENHLGELWSLFDFITPGLLGSFSHFSQSFMGTVNPETDKKARARLKKLIQPFILRRLKSQVLQELPARTEITLRVKMSTEEAALYEAQRRSAVDKLTNIEAEEASPQQFRIFAEIMRLRRLCCNPSLVLPNCTIESAKLKVFGELLDEILGNHHKALVFSQFVDHLEILADFLEKRQVSYQYLDGSTSAATRKKRINEFQAGKGDIFLISLKAGGSGLNLTAADYVIHMDPWWNPAVEDQASDRAHRIGQQRPVTIYRLVMGDSIEEQIIKLHREKRDLADSLLSGGDMSGKMSASELLNMLKESGI